MRAWLLKLLGASPTVTATANGCVVCGRVDPHGHNMELLTYAEVSLLTTDPRVTVDLLNHRIEYLWKAPLDSVVVRCPECQSLEGVPVVNIRSYAISHDGKRVAEETIGYRVACQRCACIYSIAPTGVFRHHPQSSPLTPEARPHVEKDAPDPNGVMPPQFQRPIPKRAPSV